MTGDIVHPESRAAERRSGSGSVNLLADFPSLEVARPTSPGSPGTRNPFGAALIARHVIRPEFGEGRRDFLSFPRGLQVAHSRFRLSVDSIGTCRGQDLFKLHFSLAGLNTLRYAGQPERVLRGPCVSMSVHPGGVDKIDCHPRGAWEHSLTFACRAAFLSDVLRLDPDVLPPPLRRFAGGFPPQFFFATLPLPRRAVKLIEEFLSPVCSEQVAHIHAEARALDLLCLGLDLLIDDSTRSRRRLSPRDTRALQAVREGMGISFLQPTSIAQVARDAGLNRTKLTEGFRTLFGETVHECLTRLRMQHARQMLEAGHSAASVAAELGYQHQCSFSTAFRLYFGRVPRALQKTRIAGGACRRSVLSNSKKELSGA